MVSSSTCSLTKSTWINRWIMKYADDQNLFFEDFKNVYVKLVNSGARWTNIWITNKNRKCPSREKPMIYICSNCMYLLAITIRVHKKIDKNFSVKSRANPVFWHASVNTKEVAYGRPVFLLNVHNMLAPLGKISETSYHLFSMYLLIIIFLSFFPQEHILWNRSKNGVMAYLCSLRFLLDTVRLSFSSTVILLVLYPYWFKFSLVTHALHCWVANLDRRFNLD